MSGDLLHNVQASLGKHRGTFGSPSSPSWLLPSASTYAAKGQRGPREAPSHRSQTAFSRHSLPNCSHETSPPFGEIEARLIYVYAQRNNVVGFRTRRSTATCLSFSSHVKALRGKSSQSAAILATPSDQGAWKRAASPLSEV